jgi:hypothetical protein
MAACSGEFASWPVSRVLFGGLPLRDGHSSGARIAPRLEQPTRAVAWIKLGCRSRPRHPTAPIRSCSRWGLPCRLRRRKRGALLPHRFTLTFASCPAPAVCSLWHFPWGRPRRPLAATVDPWSPDFPPPGACGRKACSPGSGRPASWQEAIRGVGSKRSRGKTTVLRKTCAASA